MGRETSQQNILLYKAAWNTSYSLGSFPIMNHFISIEPFSACECPPALSTAAQTPLQVLYVLCVEAVPREAFKISPRHKMFSETCFG